LTGTRFLALFSGLDHLESSTKFVVLELQLVLQRETRLLM